ncbi:conjugative transposon protein TraM [Flavobacterium muglaense]|uniref:Conjugative transposon protein TraM n=1 Tax=Flavobacterium muglaense TaxID=2764716 RepID=A0A923N0V0_9FLAO|nr:conjugative transposon protein TraM [Flavobacterium muglaense]MBC5838161.1 conjugative transposon protein TraM [Flavobacterium muglaense]MBC5844695.1 conjugative transposon protein TraM [Flavobacterium muglaense]
MKENENKKSAVYVTDGSINTSPDELAVSREGKVEKIKKPIIFGLMAIVFFGCMYLIFKPAENVKNIEILGLNDSVPQPTTIGLENDKQKAYEQELLEQKNQEKQNALTSLSDYWNEGSTEESLQDVPEKEGNSNASLNSYRNAQNTLGSFYNNDNSETQELRKQLEELKKEMVKKEESPTNVVDNQLELMEKSYQMAAKYLPINSASPENKSTGPSSPPKEAFVSIIPERYNVVSNLKQSVDEQLVIAVSNSTFTSTDQQQQTKNSIRAVVQETQLVSEETSVSLRLLEPARIQNKTIPIGTVVTANSKFQQGRLQLKIISIELEGNILPIELTIYGLDGQQGLAVPYSPERNAMIDMAANMGQTSGSSIMLSTSAGQQIAGDLSRGLVQGVSNYFSKKIKTPKVTLKAGLQVLLVSKK